MWSVNNRECMWVIRRDHDLGCLRVVSVSNLVAIRFDACRIVGLHHPWDDFGC